MSARSSTASPRSGLPTEAYWRNRAENCRECAVAATTEDAREAFLNIAIMYDSMADRAARREARVRRRAGCSPGRSTPTQSASEPKSSR
jgi:hypothetical protein